MRLMEKATALPAKKIAYFDESETVQARLHKSLKVWSMYADLEESFGTFNVSTNLRIFIGIVCKNKL